MALFGFFNKKNENRNVIPFQVSTNTPESLTEEVTNEVPEVETKTPTNRALTVSYATGWPMDVVYGYLHKDYEQNGFDDAMLNSNLAFRDMNMKIIRNKILMVFREINLNYDAMKNSIETKIENCSAVGLLTTVAELEKQMSIIYSHKDELAKLEEDFCNNANVASVPLMSYECGFLRGISTLAMATPTTTHNSQAHVTPMLAPKSMAV